MQQTILALAAILSFTYLALGRQRHDNDVDRRTIAIEAELAATDVARARMSVLERMAFDEDDYNEAGELRSGVRMTAPTSPPGREESRVDDYDDVDDWDGYEDEVSVPVGQGALRFDVRVDVQYVRDDDPMRHSGGSATLTKEIVVTAVEDQEGETDRPPATATLRRVVTPASVASYLQ